MTSFDEESIPYGLDVDMSYDLGDEVSIPFPDLGVLERALGYPFRRREILERALTHPSYANERRGLRRHNQRLEFLGDSVVGLVLATELYLREEYEDEGALTRHLSALVCERALARKARDLELGSFVRLGKGEDGQGGRERDSILCDAYEAVIAAVFVDGGFDEARGVVRRLHARELDEGLALEPIQLNHKGQLQALVQAEHSTQPLYRIVEERGPEHAKLFVSEVEVNGSRLGRGEGKSKKEAEQHAARAAIALMARMTQRVGQRR